MLGAANPGFEGRRGVDAIGIATEVQSRRAGFRPPDFTNQALVAIVPASRSAVRSVHAHGGRGLTAWHLGLFAQHIGRSVLLGRPPRQVSITSLGGCVQLWTIAG